MEREMNEYYNHPLYRVHNSMKGRCHCKNDYVINNNLGYKLNFEQPIKEVKLCLKQ